MAEPARTSTEFEEPPVHDPHAIARAYGYHQARRSARIKRRRESKRARLRFWLFLGSLLLAFAVIGVAILQEVQNIFGI